MHGSWSTRWLAAIVVAVLVAGCATDQPSVGQATPSPADSAPATASTATASPAPASTPAPAVTPSPTPTPLSTSADLVADPPPATDPATLTFTSRQVEHLYRDGCLRVWSKPAAAERAIDQASACLGAIALVYYRYLETDGRAEQNFALARQMYADALAVLDTAGASHVTKALAGLDAAVAAAPASPTPGKQPLKKLTASATLGPATFHRRVADTFAANLGEILVNCTGFGYPGDGIPACFPYPLYQPEGKGDNPMTGRMVGAVAACEYSPRVGSLRPDRTIYNCGQAATALWVAYRVTGDADYWAQLRALAAMVAAKGDGSFAAREMREHAGCYATWVLDPDHADSCPD